MSKGNEFNYFRSKFELLYIRIVRVKPASKLTGEGG